MLHIFDEQGTTKFTACDSDDARRIAEAAGDRALASVLYRLPPESALPSGPVILEISDGRRWSLWQM